MAAPQYSLRRSMCQLLRFSLWLALRMTMRLPLRKGPLICERDLHRIALHFWKGT